MAIIKLSDNVLRFVSVCPLAQSFNLPQMLMGQIAQNSCYGQLLFGYSKFSQMILRRLGNKQAIAQDIIKYFPEHKTYIEPHVLPAGVSVLVACEESQATTIELRKLGFDAWSCDLQDCSGGHPEWHIKGDVLNVLNDGWDMMIAHPPCTYLTNSGVCWLYNKDGSRNEERWQNLKEGAEFFKALLNAPIPLIAIENPIPHKYAVELIGKKYDQLIQPYQFGHTESKATCFWVKGLPKLKPTNNVKNEWKQLPKNEAQRLHYLPPGPERAKLRSKTFQGIAQAMSEQWGAYACR